MLQLESSTTLIKLQASRLVLSGEICKIFKNTFLQKKNTFGGCFWDYKDVKLVKSETSESYHLCFIKKASCSWNIIEPFSKKVQHLL